MKLTWHDDLTGDVAAAWDARWADLDLHPFQHRELASLRARAHGQELRFLTGHGAGQLLFGAAVQIRRRAPWPVRLAVSRGPWAVDTEALIAGLRAWMGTIAAESNRPMALRLDPHHPLPADGLEAELERLGFAVAPAELHQQTVWVDLGPDEPDMLARFRTLTRRQLKKAAAGGLRSRPGTFDDLDAYLVLHRQAAGAKGYGVPERAWLASLLQSGLGDLVLTEADGRLVGGAWFARGPRTAHYLYGATAADFSGPVLYQAFWDYFRQAKAQGVQRVDLGGLPDADDGVAFFKRGFGGAEVRFGPEREMVIRPAAFATWQAARTLLKRP